MSVRYTRNKRLCTSLCELQLNGMYDVNLGPKECLKTVFCQSRLPTSGDTDKMKTLKFWVMT